jgi:hypothetical protein
VFTDDAVKRYGDFKDEDFGRVDEALGIKYENQEIFDDTVLLLRYNCPEESCDIACLGWPDLHRHVKTQHGKLMCDLCTRNKKVFTHEHELFTSQDLRKHEKFGDDNPGAVDQSGFKGHPECGFCRKRFYGDDELFTHCRDRHEKCHICDRRNNGRAQQYYLDYNALEAHFRKDHFVCPDAECLEKKFVVFGSEMDLKAHQLESHPNGMTKDTRRSARHVDISTFDYRTPHQEPQRGSRREGRGRGRDPNAEPLPPSSAQPLRRDEIAYQRQMAMVQSAQSISNRQFGGQLTAPSRPEASRPISSNHQAPSVENLTINEPPSSTANSGAQQALSPQDQARRMHHTAVMERAQTMLKGDPSKVADFRARVSSYRTGATSATDLIETFFTLFDVPSSELGKLIKELADIYENESKRAGLLKAWNDWRAINEDYPSLPGPSGVASNASTGSGGRRVLKLKSSTAQSSRSAGNQKASWNSSSSSNPFPQLPATSANPNRAGAGRVGPVPWAGASSSARPSPAPSRPTSTVHSTSRAGPAPGPDLFPALPAAAKPNTYMAGLQRGAVRWTDSRGSTPYNPWGGAPSSESSANPSAIVSEAEGDDGMGGKKKGKKGKQTLYRFG